MFSLYINTLYTFIEELSIVLNKNIGMDAAIHDVTSFMTPMLCK